MYKAENETDKKLKNDYFNKSIYYGEQSLKIHPKYIEMYLIMGCIYYDLNDYDKAADFWIYVYKLDPTHPQAKEYIELLSTVFFNEGNNFYEQGNTDEAIKRYLKSVELNSNNVESWYNLGGNYLLKDDTKNALWAWQNVLNLDPNHPLEKERFLQRKPKMQ